MNLQVIMKAPKVFEIDSVQGGYNCPEKLQRIYRDLREEVLPEEPFQQTPLRIITIQDSGGWRGGQFGLEMYALEEGAIVALEYFGSWSGYAHESKQAPSPPEAGLHHIDLTVHGSNPCLEEKINDILSRYPREREVVEATNPSLK